VVDAGGEAGGPPPSGVSVSEAGVVTTELVEAFTRLMPQLSSSSPPPSQVELAEIVTSETSVLFVARDASGAIVGSLTLALFRVPTGIRAWIEDVVVDEAARGTGAGKSLVMAAVDRAGAEGAKSVDLTSRPSREAANRLYQRLGFEERTTNVYRRTPEPPDGGYRQ
jgi:ribosomal protein S18 acetylase RimI-like enzyme